MPFLSCILLNIGAPVKPITAPAKNCAQVEELDNDSVSFNVLPNVDVADAYQSKAFLTAFGSFDALVSSISCWYVLPAQSEAICCATSSEPSDIGCDSNLSIPFVVVLLLCSKPSAPALIPLLRPVIVLAIIFDFLAIVSASPTSFLNLRIAWSLVNLLPASSAYFTPLFFILSISPSIWFCSPLNFSCIAALLPSSPSLPILFNLCSSLSIALCSDCFDLSSLSSSFICASDSSFTSLSLYFFTAAFSILSVSFTIDSASFFAELAIAIASFSDLPAFIDAL